MAGKKKLTPEQACTEAVALAGGPTVVADALGISPQAVCKWKVVPPLHVRPLALLIENRVSIFDMQPAVFGGSLAELRPALVYWVGA